MFYGPALLWKRLAAFAIDLLAIDFVIIGPFRDIILALAPSAKSISGSLIWIFSIISLLAFAYFFCLDYLTGQTLGKMLLNIYVVDERYRKPSFFPAVLRNLLFIPVSPFMLLWIIDPIYLALSKNNQRLTEWLGKTRTIQAYKI